MPFKSKAQRAYMWVNNPKLAAQFEKHTPKGKTLPRKVSTTGKAKASRKMVRKK